ncbi:DUF4384 domain-containing protein [Magnetococcales bacterium HHB-1]
MRHLLHSLILIGIIFIPEGSIAKPSLRETVYHLVQQLDQQTSLEDKKIIVSGSQFFDAHSKDSLPLAMDLKNYTVSAFAQINRITVTADDPPGENTLLLRGLWSQQQKQLALTFALVSFDGNRFQRVAAVNGSVPLWMLDKKKLTPDRASIARRAARALQEHLSRRIGLKAYTVNLRPFLVSGWAPGSRLSSYLADWIRPALLDHPLLRVISVKQTDLATAPLSELRKRAVMPVVRQKTPSLSTVLLKTDGVLIGRSDFFKTHIEVHLTIEDRQGEALAATVVEIPKSMLPERILQRPEQVLSSVPFKQTPTGLTYHGLTLDLMTPVGEGKSLYHHDEKIRFLLQINRAAYLYLFNFDKKNKATLLYPLNRTQLQKQQAGRLLILPEDGLPYDLRVRPPYGKEVIFAVASEIPLSSDIFKGSWLQGDRLRRDLRQQGYDHQKGYAEAELHLQTQP